ncbi:hypothetical protein QBC32DRAFT_91357 [Pseudoneurospora amorphoporcata]|uniref:DUF7624 domain-containing protein n=1 Tax=Pseudoneurospora amorphoporcata TaxID=241081 RepID=A0AAN6NK51_9PEZI|nr:hypothetical protein QBC32DRAFT_91357 [Pseudoneurospora amorphoporcata]
MALEAPLRSSTGSFKSIYSPYTEMSLSAGPDSPLPAQFMASSSASDSQSLRPASYIRPNSAHLLLSPTSDIVGPSPVTSNGTETTEIEDDEAEEHAGQGHGQHGHHSLMMLRTNLPDHIRKSMGDEVVSVIHAPPSFENWKSSDNYSRSSVSNSVSAASAESSTISPPASEASTAQSPPTHSLPMVNTNVKPVAFGLDAPTPQAQRLEDVFASENTRMRSSTASSLELIPESHEGDQRYEDADDFLTAETTPSEQTEIQALSAALEECWTLCNTLANLSSIHRERVFNSSGTPDAHEKAWKSCWKLCKRLYQSRNDYPESHNIARTNLDLCRDFCQSLFDVRQKKDEVADSILRVSFELNNHLYTAQDTQSLPEAFRERTLDFYITLCHRLMKQRNDSPEETDSLLRACWALAEMLFSLRQNRRDGKAPDEELLGSAVQACWELCDIFREGWTQIRPDRGTPRPSHINFFSPGSYGLQSLLSNHQSDSRSNAGSRASMRSKRESLRSLSDLTDRPRNKPIIPETPVTEFEDTPVSPDASPQMPNIMVLGPSNDRSDSRGGRWSSSASNLSGYSQSSQHTSSTATTATATIEDMNITRIKVLIVKAAMNIGFSRETAAADGKGGSAALQTFVKSLPTGSFGSLPMHATLLQNYKNLVLTDSAFRASASLPPRGKRISAIEIAKSVNWMMMRSGQYSFLKDLFRLVFGFQVEDAESRKNASVAV